MLSRVAVSLPAAAFAISALILSKAFVDYSTSGLENPLTHLLLALFFAAEGSTGVNQPPSARCCRRLTALLMLNRVDTGLLVLPALAVEIWRAGIAARLEARARSGCCRSSRGKRFRSSTTASWFRTRRTRSCSHGVPRPEILYQGFLYLLDSIGNDPLTLLLILAGPSRRAAGAGARGWTAPLGIALYLGYIVWVGGDFMGGRFLTAPFLAAVVHLSQAGRAAVHTSGGRWPRRWCG